MSREWAERIVVIGFLVGVLLYGFACYRVVMAGGMSAGGSSQRMQCSGAATGAVVPGYRTSERLRITRSYLPPSAVCHWSSGASTVLVGIDALTVAGPVLLAAAGLTAILQQRRSRRRGVRTG